MKKYAVVVGVQAYEDPEITDLQYAAHDAEEVARALREQCEFDKVCALYTGGDREPTHTNVYSALRELRPLAKPEDLFLFYFAGHGLHQKGSDGEGGQSHLLAANTYIDDIDLASIRLDILRKYIRDLGVSQRASILDACRNDPHQARGGGDNSMSKAFSRDVLLAASDEINGAPPLTCTLFSCSVGERAYEWPEEKHGVFTYFFLDGLRGHALKNGPLSIQALGAYTLEKVDHWARKKGRRQRPWADQHGAPGEIILARKNVVILPEQPMLRITTEPSGATVAVNGRPAGKSPLDIELISGQHTVRIEHSNYQVWERCIQFDATGNADLPVTLELILPKPPPPSTRPAAGHQAAIPPATAASTSPERWEGLFAYVGGKMRFMALLAAYIVTGCFTSWILLKASPNESMESVVLSFIVMPFMVSITGFICYLLFFTPLCYIIAGVHLVLFGDAEFLNRIRKLLSGEWLSQKWLSDRDVVLLICAILYFIFAILMSLDMVYW